MPLCRFASRSLQILPSPGCTATGQPDRCRLQSEGSSSSTLESKQQMVTGTLRNRELAIKFSRLAGLQLLETVPKPPDGGQIARVVRFSLNVFPQAPDMHIHGPRRHETLLAPNLFQKLIPTVS